MAFKAKTKKKRKPKSDRKKLVEKLDVIVSLIVRARDRRCVLCGNRTNLTNGHLFTRALYQIRWDLDNCHAQCIGCNFLHEFDPYPYTEWFRKKFGDKLYHDLYRKGHNGKRFSDLELKQLLAHFQEIYEKNPLLDKS